MDSIIKQTLRRRPWTSFGVSVVGGTLGCAGLLEFYSDYQERNCGKLPHDIFYTVLLSGSGLRQRAFSSARNHRPLLLPIFVHDNMSLCLVCLSPSIDHTLAMHRFIF